MNKKINLVAYRRQCLVFLEGRRKRTLGVVLIVECGLMVLLWVGVPDAQLSEQCPSRDTGATGVIWGRVAGRGAVRTWLFPLVFGRTQLAQCYGPQPPVRLPTLSPPLQGGHRGQTTSSGKPNRWAELPFGLGDPRCSTQSAPGQRDLLESCLHTVGSTGALVLL